METIQLTDELLYLLKNSDFSSEWEKVFTSVNSLIWNSNSKGILNQVEFSELKNRLNEKNLSKAEKQALEAEIAKLEKALQMD